MWLVAGHTRDKQPTEGDPTMHHVIDLKRSVATLACAAGLLVAAAGPANAQVLPGTIGVSTPHAGHGQQVASAALCTITCLDQDLNSLKFDSDEIAELRAPQRNSLGRENSIEV